MTSSVDLPSPADPTVSAFLPRCQMRVRPAAVPISGPVAKLGGQPCWLDTPAWPLAARTSEPMMFVGQLPIPGDDARMAYLFVTDDDDGMAEGYFAEGGDTALLIQPGGRIPPFVHTSQQATGPSLWRRGAVWEEKIPAELHIDLTLLDPVDEQRLDAAIACQDDERARCFPESLVEFPERGGDLVGYLGGRPLFWQPDCTEVAASWQFLYQLDSGAEDYNTPTYTLNFGENGTGYAFLSPDRLEGRFFWDCI